MVFDGRYKLSYFVGRIHELYDLQEDPDELVNQIANPDYAAVAADLTTRLLAHMDECNSRRTQLSKKVACEKRLLINRLYAEGKDIFNL